MGGVLSLALGVNLGFQEFSLGVLVLAQRLTNPDSIQEDTVSISGLAQWVKDRHCREVQLGSHSCRPAAVALI